MRQISGWPSRGSAFAVLAAPVHVHFRLQQVVHHGRNQRARQQVGGQHGEHHRQRQRREQKLGRAGQQQHRHEHDADGERGNKRRHRDLLRAIQNRAHQRLLHRQIAMGVFDLDGRVVHQNADRQRQAAQRHHVDRLAHQVQDDRAKSGSKAESRCRRSACCASFPGTAGSSSPSARPR